MRHHAPWRWQNGHLQSVAKEQEFVADIGEHADAHRWLSALFTNTDKVGAASDQLGVRVSGGPIDELDHVRPSAGTATV
jgi:hypothetical protein